MGKQGPCFHCGIERTPLWRNGPPDKPVLCNACGSRYRLGKSLENYSPKNNSLVIRKRKTRAAPTAKAIAADRKPVVTSNACCYSSSHVLEDHYASSDSSIVSHYDHLNRCHIKQENGVDDENPENCEGRLWGSQIPSRRRSQVVYGGLSTIQKLRRDLHNILKDEDPFNGCAPEDVLIHNVNINKLQIPSTEIGLGSILLKFPVTDYSQEQKLESCSSRSIDAEIASPSLQVNACGDHDDDVDGVQNEASPVDPENEKGNSRTEGAAGS